jgi:hypothetical protein
MRSRGWLWAMSAAGLLMACGKSNGSAAPVQQRELPSRIAGLICNSMATCCQSDGFAFDNAGCKSNLASELEGNLQREFIANLEYDAQAAGDCLAAAQVSLQCGEVEDNIPACERMFYGTLELGAPCTDAAECREADGQSVSCMSEDGVSAQVCTLILRTFLRRGNAGEGCFTTCSAEAEDCDWGSTPAVSGPPVGPSEPVGCYREDGLFCERGTCAPLRAIGEACEDYASCAGDGFCDYITARCSLRRANGEPCQSGNECQSGRCESAASSSAEVLTGRCVSRPTVSAEACAEDFAEDPEPTSPSPSPGAR